MSRDKKKNGKKKKSRGKKVLAVLAVLLVLFWSGLVSGNRKYLWENEIQQGGNACRGAFEGKWRGEYSADWK